MKGIIIAGSYDNRLIPITLGIPKQLIPIYNKPMIYYPIETLVNSGIIDILIITKSEYQKAFQKAIGRYLDANYSYAVQENANGIAEALIIGRDFIGNDSVCLITGDMIIAGSNVNNYLKKAIRTVVKSGNATIFIENKTYPDQYGKVIVDNNGKVTDIIGDGGVDKYYSIASIYFFPNKVLNMLDSLSASDRGRLEVLDLNRRFFEACKLQIRILGNECIWFDTNTFDGILKCSVYMSQHSQI